MRLTAVAMVGAGFNSPWVPRPHRLPSAVSASDWGICGVATELEVEATRPHTPVGSGDGEVGQSDNLLIIDVTPLV